MAGNFFRGTSVDQDGRWGKSDEKLLNKMTKDGRFAPILETKVDIKKVNLDVISKWIHESIVSFVGFEDDILINLVINVLQGSTVDPKKLQLDVTGFLDKRSGPFITELWTLLVDAQSQPNGIPSKFMQQKIEEIAARKKSEVKPGSRWGPAVENQTEVDNKPEDNFEERRRGRSDSPARQGRSNHQRDSGRFRDRNDSRDRHGKVDDRSSYRERVRDNSRRRSNSRDRNRHYDSRRREDVSYKEMRDENYRGRVRDRKRSDRSRDRSDSSERRRGKSKKSRKSDNENGSNDEHRKEKKKHKHHKHHKHHKKDKKHDHSKDRSSSPAKRDD